jgi:hypothetical protein
MVEREYASCNVSDTDHTEQTPAASGVRSNEKF